MRLAKFDGGISRRLTPKHIGVNEAVELTNVDTTTGVLTPVKNSVAGESISGDYLVYWDGSLRSVGFPNLVFNNDFYSVVSGRLTNSAGEVGLATPTAALTLSATEGSSPITAVSINVGEALVDPETLVEFGAPNQTAQYALVRLSHEEETWSKPLIITVDLDASTSSSELARAVTSLFSAPDNIYEHVAAAAKRVLDSAASGDYRTVTFSDFPFDTEFDNTVWLARLVRGRFKFFASTTSLVGGTYTSVIDSNSDDEVIAAPYSYLDELTFNELGGILNYVYTFYDPATDTESGPSPVSADIDMLDTGRALLSLPAAPYTVPKRRIYRVGNSITTFTRVDEIDATDTTYLDKLTDSDIARNNTLTTEGYAAPPSDISSLAAYNGVVFGVEGNKLRFTPQYVPYAWPELNFLDYKEDIIGLATTTNGLLVFLSNETHIVTGSSAADIRTYLLSADQGCTSPRSIASINGVVLWTSLDGICSSSGGSVDLVSNDKLGIVYFEDVKHAIVHNRSYYLLLGSGRVVCLDFSLQPKFKEFQILSSAKSFVLIGDKLHFTTGEVVYEMFASSTNSEILFRSAQMTDGSELEAKLYKRVRVAVKGDIILKVYIDNVLATSVECSGTGVKEVLIPVDYSRGYSIQFEISGTGEVYELDYSVKSAQQ